MIDCPHYWCGKSSGPISETRSSAGVPPSHPLQNIFSKQNFQAKTFLRKEHTVMGAKLELSFPPPPKSTLGTLDQNPGSTARKRFQAHSNNDNL